MKTATAHTRPAVNTPATQPDPGPFAPDFDTRLMLASIGMDVLLARAGGQALADAHAAVTAAVAAADRYGAEAVALEGLTAAQRPVTHRSSRILARAADIIRDRGWHQGDWTDSQGAVCALQAIRLAAGDDTDAAADAAAVLLDRIRNQFGDHASSVPGWNDRRERTEADVLYLLG
jgi:hypothetical protein